MPATQLAMSTSSRLLDVLRNFDQVLVVMHDNPDPDAIASGWGIEVLVRECLSKPVRIIAGGAIVRAENCHMVDLLQPPIELVEDVEIDESTATILVDCGMDATNHLLTRRGITPIGIIDHHRNGKTPKLPFIDIQVEVAASATIVADYLRQQGIDPCVKLATAMLYAMRSETCAYETHYSPLDRSIFSWLTEYGDPGILAEIESAPLSREYFADLLLAMQSTFLYDDVAICFLPQAGGAEIVGEVADMLVRCDGVRRVLCGAIVDGDLFVSARTQRDSDSAANLIQTALKGLGGAGGHMHRAGGKVSGFGKSERAANELRDELRTRWLAACNVTRKRGTRLIAKQDIVGNLER